jgi:hypothetical protein
MLDDIRQMNEINEKQFGHPEIAARLRLGAWWSNHVPFPVSEAG